MKPLHYIVTAFDAFGGESVNSVEEVLENLPDSFFWKEDLSEAFFMSDNKEEAEEGHSVRLTKLLLPTSFKQSEKILEEIFREENFDGILNLGQNAMASAIHLERVAINIDDARIADNEDYKPEDAPILVDGPAAYFSKLPLRHLEAKLKNAGIPVLISNSAGTFVCNHVMYKTLDLCRKREERGLETIPAGFVHLPSLPLQTLAAPNRPSMALDMMVQAIEIILKNLQ